MKAGIYDPYLDTLGGGERYTLTLAEILSKNGHSVDVFWSKDPDILNRAQQRFSLRLDSVKLVPDCFYSNPISPPSLFRQVRDFIHRFSVTKNYDFFFFVSDGSLPFLFSRQNLLHFQVPFTPHHSFPQTFLNRLKSRTIHQVVVNSQFTQRFIQSSYPLKSTVLYPPVDIEQFSVSPDKKDIILAVGRFDNILNTKRQDALIEAFARLSPTQPKWRLVLAGGSQQNPADNQYLKHLQYLARNLPVDFMINPSFTTLAQVYSETKIFWHAAGYQVDAAIHPEATEHFGMTTVEAMASGLVPLVPKNGGLPEIITSGVNGFLWEDLDTLIAKTQLLIGSPSTLRDLSRQAQLSSHQFSKSIFETSFLQIISS
jgi:glycosyltransferase involved in cell wall biosynthesis